MHDQNIYDNEVFFEGYRKLREQPSAANHLVEKPALFSLCPNLSGKRVLDLGCGYGENCREFLHLGASHVTGLDLSEKMLQIAKAENDAERISFVRMSMSDLSALDGTFDVVFSSLAVHYVEDFDQLLAQIHRLLTDGGIFLFSQEHPFTTALRKGPRWSQNEDGTINHYNLSDYGLPGIRTTTWIVDGVIKYHRTFSDIVNALSTAGFQLEQMLEPLPGADILAQYPAYQKCYHKPDFLLVRAKKCCV